MGLYHQRATFPKSMRAHPLDLSQPSAARKASLDGEDPDATLLGRGGDRAGSLG
jgi:hypothetical protein